MAVPREAAGSPGGALRRGPWGALAVVVLLLLVLLLACLLWPPGFGPPARAAVGGAAALLGGRPAASGKRPAAPKPATHIVVDTLNLVHWLGARDGEKRVAMSAELIARAVDRTAPILRARYPGRVVYVLKDRETGGSDEAAHAVYRAAAERNRVTLLVALRYAEPLAGSPTSASHSARGRDDFLMALQAHRLRCPVLTADRLRDFAEFRATVPPFHTVEYAFWRQLPLRDFIGPAVLSFARLPRPATVHPAAVFGESGPPPLAVADGAPRRKKRGAAEPARPPAAPPAT